MPSEVVAFYAAGALNFACAISPPSNFDDESAAADLFGPDEGWGDEDVEPAVASRDLVDGGEVRLDSDDRIGAEEPVIAQAPVGIPSPSQPTAIEVALHWLTHLPYRSWCKWCVCLLSGRTHRTIICPTTPERFRCLSLTIALSGMLEMKIS